MSIWHTQNAFQFNSLRVCRRGQFYGLSGTAVLGESLQGGGLSASIAAQGGLVAREGSEREQLSSRKRALTNGSTWPSAVSLVSIFNFGNGHCVRPHGRLVQSIQIRLQFQSRVPNTCSDEYHWSTAHRSGGAPSSRDTSRPYATSAVMCDPPGSGLINSAGAVMLNA